MDTSVQASELVDRLRVLVYADRLRMGAAAATAAADRLRRLLASQPRVRAVFASAPSQDELLAGLAEARGIDWSRITVFHMDEYLGLPADSPASFASFLRKQLFDRVRPAEVHLIDGSGRPEEECRRYAALLAAAPIDLVCLGIGENGHLAFNDPPVADFDDPQLVKVVEIDAVSRQQQVNDGQFEHLSDVPTTAITLTIAALVSAAAVICVVPGPRKRAAVASALRGPVSPACPASILRTHPDATVYLDAAAYPPP